MNMKYSLYIVVIISLVLLLVAYRGKNCPIQPKGPWGEITADDIYISIKTARINHRGRVHLIAKTWYNWAPKSIYLVTDSNDTFLYKKFGERFIITECNRFHSPHGLKCKLYAEYTNFFGKGKKWWCHVDDDNFINIPKLVEVLNKYDYRKKVSIGKPPRYEYGVGRRKGRQVTFVYGAGGAGFCMSKALMEDMREPMRKHFLDGYITDDVWIFYIADVYCETRLTIEIGFWSHSYNLKASIPSFAVPQQVTLSRKGNNTIAFGGQFDNRTDPSRFMSLYCHQVPNGEICKKTSF